MTDTSQTQREKAVARYMAVRHLSHAAAAEAMGLSVSAVVSYRRTCPAVAQTKAPVAPPMAPAAPREYPGTTVHTVRVNMPYSSADTGGVRLMQIRLPTVPGVTLTGSGARS